MKKLFIILKIRDGEREYTQRILHTTNAKNIKFAAQRYASTFQGYGMHYKGEKHWWFNYETTVELYSVVELTNAEFKLLSNLFGE